MPSYYPTVLLRPKTPQESVTLLREGNGAARLVAGNTTIYELAHQGGLSDVDKLIDISQLGLTYIREMDDKILVGATTTFSELASSPLLKRGDVQVIAETAGKITPPQVRNMGTVGGALSSGIPFYDLPTAILAMGATLRVLSPDGEKKVEIDGFFVDYFMTSLGQDEMILEAQFDKRGDTGSAFIKLGRLSVDFAVVNCAARVTLNKDKTSVQEARIALGAVANTPIRSQDAEKKLKGGALDMANILAAAKEAANFEPTPSIHASPTYKKRVIPVLVRDVLLAAVERAGGRVKMN